MDRPPGDQGQVTTADFTNSQPNAASLAASWAWMWSGNWPDRSGIGVRVSSGSRRELPYATVALTIDNLLAPSAPRPPSDR